MTDEKIKYMDAFMIKQGGVIAMRRWLYVISIIGALLFSSLFVAFAHGAIPANMETNTKSLNDGLVAY